MIDDPLHVPAALRDDQTDYQWFSTLGVWDPAATGWVPVSQLEMAPFHVEHKELRLFKRPMVVTEHVRTQERAVAEALLVEPGRPKPTRIAHLTTPLGANPLPWSLKRWLIYLAIATLRWFERGTGIWLVGKAYGTNHLGLRRWAEENQMMPLLYVETLASAILKGRGKWLGPIIIGRAR